MGLFGWNSNEERLSVLYGAGTFIRKMAIDAYMILHEAWMMKYKDAVPESYKYGDASSSSERIETLCFTAKDFSAKKSLTRIWKIEDRKIISFEKAYPELSENNPDHAGDLNFLEKFYKEQIDIKDACGILQIRDVTEEFYAK